jgi:hypothetical protein
LRTLFSNSINQLEYESEVATTIVERRKMIDAFYQLDRTDLSVLDLGAGDGYWAGLSGDPLSNDGFELDPTPFDILIDGLAVIRAILSLINLKNPTILTFPCYYLHSLTRA